MYSLSTYCLDGFLIVRADHKMDLRQSVMVAVDLWTKDLAGEAVLQVMHRGAAPPACIVEALIKESARIFSFGPLTEPPPSWYAHAAELSVPPSPPRALDPRLN